MRQPSTPVELGRCQAIVLDDLLRLRIRSAQERATDFLEPPAGNVEDRWAIYASGFLARLVEALEKALDTASGCILVSSGAQVVNEVLSPDDDHQENADPHQYLLHGTTLATTRGGGQRKMGPGVGPPREAPCMARGAAMQDTPGSATGRWNRLI